VLAGRFDAGREVARGLQKPDLCACRDDDTVGLDGQPHRTLEVIVRERELTTRHSDGGNLARLVGGDEQGDAKLV